MKNKRYFFWISLLLCTALLLALAATACAAGEKKTFSDVKPGSWYYSTVTAMCENRWISGYKDGAFRPGREISGAEFICIAAQGRGLTPGRGQSAHWASDMMQAALDRGWYDWDEFPPTAENYDRPITRQVAAKVLKKAFFPDASWDYNACAARIADFSQIDGRYYEGVFSAYGLGVISGYPDGTFRPRGSLTRAEACSMIALAARAAGEDLLPAPTPDGPAESRKGGVQENGWLQVKGSQLCNEAGEPVVLHGMSTHGLQWYGQFASSGAIKTTADYGANLFRVAMYTGEGGYLSQPDAIKKQAAAAVDAAIRNDMYVILDWHILSDGNPQTHLQEAQAFFADMAERYRDEPALLYEICNEPNGSVTWSRDVKPYAQALVKTIREAGSNGVILIGSPTWSQDIHLAAQDPVEGENLAYTLHFYAGTHGRELQDRIDGVLKKDLAVFVSEWGTSRADGSGGVFLQEAAQWLDFLDSRGISWANWSLCDKGETSAALQPGAFSGGGWTEKDLSPSGQFVFSRF